VPGDSCAEDGELDEKGGTVDGRRSGGAGVEEQEEGSGHLAGGAAVGSQVDIVGVISRCVACEWGVCVCKHAFVHTCGVLGWGLVQDCGVKLEGHKLRTLVGKAGGARPWLLLPITLFEPRHLSTPLSPPLFHTHTCTHPTYTHPRAFHSHTTPPAASGARC